MSKWDLILEKIQKKGQKIVVENALANSTWLKTYPTQQEKILFIFRTGNELLVSKNGEAKSGKWEFMDAGELLLISINAKKSLFNCMIFNNEFLLLNKDGSNDSDLFVNYDKFKEFSAEIIKKIIEQNLLSSSSLPENIDEIKQQDVFFFNKNDQLKKPRDPRVKDLQGDSTKMIKENLQKFDKYIPHYSKELPVYLCYELNKRGYAVSLEVASSLNKFAKKEGAKNFDEYVNEFKI